MTGRRVGARAVIPLFPLGAVLVPGLVLPLHIFEPRYRRLMQDLQTRREDDRAFGVVAIREGWEVGEDGVTAMFDVGTLAVVRDISPYPDGRYDLVTNGDARFRVIALAESDAPYLMAEVEWLAEDGVTAMFDVGTLAVVREITPYPDGRYDVVTNGDARFRIHALAESDAPYLMAEVEWLAEDGAGDGAAAEAAVLAQGVVRRFDAYRSAVAETGAIEAAQMLELPADPRILSYLVAVAMVLDLSDRQVLLEAATTSDRLRLEAALLARETLIVRELPSLPAVDLARTTSALN